MPETPPDPADPEAATTPGSVFGNLPDSRPGGRSPRRDATRKPRAAKAAAKPRAKASTATKPKPKPGPAAAPRPSPPPPEPAAEPESGGGLEDIAWAGVAAAAEAATLGIRLANRALEALRGNPEKS